MVSKSLTFVVDHLDRHFGARLELADLLEARAEGVVEDGRREVDDVDGIFEINSRLYFLLDARRATSAGHRAARPNARRVVARRLYERIFAGLRSSSVEHVEDLRAYLPTDCRR